MAKLPRFSLSHNDKNKKWELKREGSGEVIKRFKTKAAATKGGVLGDEAATDFATASSATHVKIEGSAHAVHATHGAHVVDLINRFLN